MKKFIYYVLIALITISCNNKRNAPLDIPASFHAQTPLSSSNSNLNRTAREYEVESWDDSERTYAVVDPSNSSEYFQYWSEGDAISVFFTTANLKYSLTSFEELDHGIFELSGSATEGNEINTDYYYSVYPYKENTTISRSTGDITYTFPETQHYSGDTYANGENGMIAIEKKTEYDEILYFQNFCSYLQLRLVNNSDENKTIKRITLTANSTNDKMAGSGTIKIKDENSAPTVTMKKTASSKITLDCGNGVELSQNPNDPTKFWFVLPGSFKFTEGFSINVIFSDQTYFKKSTAKQITIERNHIKPMAILYPDYTNASGQIRYKYENTDNSVPFPLGNTFLDKDGNPLEIVDQTYDEENQEWVVLLSGTLKAIGGNSFKGPGSDLEYIKINSDDESISINDFAFYNCTAELIEIEDDVVSINKSAFSGSDLNNLVIKGDVDVISADAFSGCEDVKSVEMKSVETIGEKAFYMCKNLESVSMSGVKVIQHDAFKGCSSLSGEIVLDSIVEIWDAAFMDCSLLESVVISKDCIMIGEGAFCNAINLKTVYCYAIYPPFIKTDNDDGSYVFDNSEFVHPDIYIPSGSEKFYLDGYFFEDNENNWGDNNVDPTINWWAEEYYYILKEM